MREYEPLNGTVDVKTVSVARFTSRLLENNTRGYNTSNINFYDDYISFSAPYNGFGEHHTLVLTKEECEDFFNLKATMREYYSYILEEYYIPLFENWVRKDERYNIKEKLIEVLK